MSDYEIRSFEESDVLKVKKFTDKWIGQGYYSVEELEEAYDLSVKEEINCSFLAWKDEELAAVRITYAPGLWIPKARGISPALWNVPSSDVAYFKSLFVGENHQKKGLGKTLSHASIEKVKQLGGKGIICHSWLESPGNSSQKYLMRMGFKTVNNHKKYWYPIDYECTRCAPKRCICSAAEMIKHLV